LRLGPLEFRRYQAAAAPRTRVQARPERGASGTQNIDGYLQSHEYLRELTFPLSIRVYSEMRRSDPSVREALWHVWAPILNATWSVEPVSDDPLDLEVAEFVSRAYFEWQDEPFLQYLTQALRYLAHGFALFETPMKVYEGELEFENPATHEKTTVRRQWLTWRRFAERLPETVTRWHVDEGELIEIEQQAWKDGDWGEWTLPAEECVLYVNEQEGDDYSGVSLLRTAYKPWWIKTIVEQTAGVAVERHGVGINTAYVPAQYRDDDVMLDRIEEMLAKVRAGEFSYLVFPGPKATASESGRDGFTFEIVSPQGTLPDLVGYLEYLRGDIKGNVLARFAELGHGSVGARATGDVQSEVWYDALRGIARYVAAVNERAVKRLVDMNYSVEQYPKLTVSDIESRNLEEFANAHFRLLSGGAILPDASYRAFVRGIVDAPDEDDVEQRLEHAEEVLEPEGDEDSEEMPAPPEEGEQPPEPEPPPAATARYSRRITAANGAGDMQALIGLLRQLVERQAQPPVVVAPEQPQPIVHVTTPARSKRVEIRRDQQGRIESAFVQEVE
jgi:hypothetical protein